MLYDEECLCADAFLSDHADDLGDRSVFPLDNLLDTILEEA